MKKLLPLLLFALIVFPPENVSAKEGVILLHGMCRTGKSMIAMQQSLERAGFVVANIDYPSRTATIEALSENVVSSALADARLAACTKIHFVTHSLGGILVRSYLKTHRIENLGRVVMLGPPNQGSEVVDRLGSYGFFGFVNGPAGAQLGTAADSVPNRLGPVTFDLGIIAGDRSINGINSLMLPGPDDGKVSIEKTKIEGMKDHLVIHATHPYLMKNRIAIEQTLHFLRDGRFRR